MDGSQWDVLGTDKEGGVNMLGRVQKELCSVFPEAGVSDLLQSYKEMLRRYVAQEWPELLRAAGVLVENVFRLLVFLSEGDLPNEIKSVDSTRQKLESDTKISETARILIPRVAWGMLYTVRSKRCAVHQKTVTPEYIDGHLCIHAASWILAEFLREYSRGPASENMGLVQGLMKEHLPFVEVIAGETFVTANVDCKTEILIHLGKAESDGLTRGELGKRVKYSSSTITSALLSLKDSRCVFLSAAGRYHISGPGRNKLQEVLLGLLSNQQ